MSHPPDWLPYHCRECMTYMGHGEYYDRPCPEECDCGHETHATSHVCPTCGNGWMHLPPEDWEGLLLYSPEEPFREPPKNRYGRDHLGYRRSEWGARWPDNPDTARP